MNFIHVKGLNIN